MAHGVQRPHDKLFRTVFADPAEAAALLRAHLPEKLARDPRWSTLTLQDRSFVDPDLRDTESDLLFSMRRKAGAPPAWLYVLVEHQSRPDRWIRFRLLKYCCRIWDRSRAGTVDALPVEQSGTTNEGVLEVWAAGNVKRPMGRSPADAVPAIEHNVFVHVLAQAFDFTELMHTETPCMGSGCRNGLLHAKSGVLVVGAVDYRSDLDDWTLSHANGSHSARAGHARNAFLVAPDDNREETFAGTSFAAPRVSAALAILKQKCPDLSYRHLSFILLKSARDLGEQGVDKVYGFGLLDLERAFEQAESLAAMFESYDSTIPATTP